MNEILLTCLTLGFAAAAALFAWRRSRLNRLAASGWQTPDVAAYIWGFVNELSGYKQVYDDEFLAQVYRAIWIECVPQKGFSDPDSSPRRKVAHFLCWLKDDLEPMKGCSLNDARAFDLIRKGRRAFAESAKKQLEADRLPKQP